MPFLVSVFPSPDEGFGLLTLLSTLTAQEDHFGRFFKNPHEDSPQAGLRTTGLCALESRPRTLCTNPTLPLSITL